MSDLLTVKFPFSSYLVNCQIRMICRFTEAHINTNIELTKLKYFMLSTGYGKWKGQVLNADNVSDLFASVANMLATVNTITKCLFQRSAKKSHHSKPLIFIKKPKNTIIAYFLIEVSVPKGVLWHFLG